MSFLETLKAAAAGPPPSDSSSTLTNSSSNNSAPSFPRVGSHSSLSTIGSRAGYGRLKRAPKLPLKPPLQSSESSSATDDLSGSEESSSSCLEDADNEAVQVSFETGASGLDPTKVFQYRITLDYATPKFLTYNFLIKFLAWQNPA